MQYLKFKIYKQITHCKRKNILIEIIPNEIETEKKNNRTLVAGTRWLFFLFIF